MVRDRLGFIQKLDRKGVGKTVRNTFRGGVHPEEHKELSREARLRLFDPKGEMVFPLQQHIGKPAKAVVQKGDAVLVGQKIAEADGFVSANIYSSCSGTVKTIEKRRVLGGGMGECIVIDNDGQFTPAADYSVRDSEANLSENEIIQRVQDAGIVGLGGAGFPTHVKLKPKDPAAIEYVIANGAECEPYLTCNDQLMRTHAPAIVEGLELVLRLFPNAEGVICIEDNKPEAIHAMELAASGKQRITVQTMITKYPQGGERSLIQAVTGVDFPISKLPADVGCIVQNVGTLYAIQRAVLYHEPLFSQCFTVTGEAVKEPSNFFRPRGYQLRGAAAGLRRREGRKGSCQGTGRRTDDGRGHGQPGRSDPEAEQRTDAAGGGSCRTCGKADDRLPALRPLHHGVPGGPDAPAHGGRRHRRGSGTV